MNPAWDWEGGGASRTLAVGAHLGPGGSATPKEAPLPAHIFRLCLSGGEAAQGDFGVGGRRVTGGRLGRAARGGGTLRGDAFLESGLGRIPAIAALRTSI